MKGFKSALAVLSLSAVCASAYSQEFAYEYSGNNYAFVFGGSDVTVSDSGYVVYNLAGNYAKGNASYNGFTEGFYGPFGDYSFAHNGAYAGPGYGFAQTGYGFEQYLTFTNHNTDGIGESFYVVSLLYEVMNTSKYGFAEDFGGIREFGGQYFYGFNTVVQSGYGAASIYSYNWSVGLDFSNPGYSFILSEGKFTDTLAAGQSITVGIWASGITTASSAGSSTPGPAAIAPFAVGLLGALRRRNKKG